jgi:hypothetical protein
MLCPALPIKAAISGEKSAKYSFGVQLPYPWSALEWLISVPWVEPGDANLDMELAAERGPDGAYRQGQGFGPNITPN